MSQGSDPAWFQSSAEYARSAFDLPMKRSRSNSWGGPRPSSGAGRFVYGTARPGYMSRRRRSRRRGAVRSNPVLGGQTQIINPQAAMPMVTLAKTIVAYGGIQNGAGADLSLGLIFDPSGTYDTATTPMPDWTNIRQLYDQYKVNSITVTATYYGSGSQTAPLNIFGRYSYDRNFLTLTPTIALMREMQNVKVHTFTPDCPKVSWKILPQMGLVTTDPGVLSSQGHSMHRADWIDINYPCELYGFAAVAQALPSGVHIEYDVEYNVSFRCNK